MTRLPADARGRADHFIERGSGQPRVFAQQSPKQAECIARSCQIPTDRVQIEFQCEATNPSLRRTTRSVKALSKMPQVSPSRSRMRISECTGRNAGEGPPARGRAMPRPAPPEVGQLAVESGMSRAWLPSSSPSSVSTPRSHRVAIREVWQAVPPVRGGSREADAFTQFPLGVPEQLGCGATGFIRTCKIEPGNELWLVREKTFQVVLAEGVAMYAETSMA